MKCPKCGYVSHDYLNACRKCSVDLLGFKAQMQLHAVQTGNIDLRSVLGGVQADSGISGKFNPGDLFASPMLVDAQAESGFDINLDDDFSFTPSAMSLESLDGFEVSNIDSMQLEQQRSADPPSPSTESPDTGYATVMMDTSGLHDEAPPLESASDMDVPVEIAGPDLDAPIESAEAVIDLPETSLVSSPDEPEITQAELRSSVGRTSDLDLTSMDLGRTTRDIEIMNQLKSEALSGDTVLPEFNELMASHEAAEAISPEPQDDEPIRDGQSDTGIINALLDDDDTASSFSPTLPEAFPEEVDDTEALSQDSGELILPSFDADFPSVEVVDNASSSGSASRSPEDAFTMPDLPEVTADEKLVSPFTEEISIAIDPLAPPEPPPMTFPSLQTTILPTPEGLPRSDEAAPVEEASTSEPIQSAIEDDAAGSPDTGSMTTELNFGNPDASHPDETFLAVSPRETKLSEEPSTPLVPEPPPFGSVDTGYATIAMNIDHTAAPGTPAPDTPDEAIILPDLPEPVEASPPSSHDDPTIIDQPSLFASAAPPPAVPTEPPADADSATIALDISDIHTLDVPLPDLPDPTDTGVSPSYDEPTIVDEPSPFAASGHTPVDFNVAPPHTQYDTLEMDLNTPQRLDVPMLPDLPDPTYPLLAPSADEPTIVDEPSPFALAGHSPADSSTTPSDEMQADVHEIDEDLELLFPDEEQLPQQHD